VTAVWSLASLENMGIASSVDEGQAMVPSGIVEEEEIDNLLQRNTPCIKVSVVGCSQTPEYRHASRLSGSDFDTRGMRRAAFPQARPSQSCWRGPALVPRCNAEPSLANHR
jgi:hypothetical protein